MCERRVDSLYVIESSSVGKVGALKTLVHVRGEVAHLSIRYRRSAYISSAYLASLLLEMAL